MHRYHLLLLFAVAVHARPKGSGRCTVDDDCQLNGVCTDGSCVCDAAWTGEFCTFFDATPVQAAAFSRTNASSWGGSVFWSDCDAQYHLYVSDMTGGCGLNVWASGSRILHAIAPKPMGPFTPVGTVGNGIALPPETHNPAVIYTPDDQILLFHIGNGTTNSWHSYWWVHNSRYNRELLQATSVLLFISGRAIRRPAGLVTNCSANANGTTPPGAPLMPTPTPPPGFVVGDAVHTARSPEGPWTPANLTVVSLLLAVRASVSILTLSPVA
jgi:hypothetical protein